MIGIIITIVICIVLASVGAILISRKKLSDKQKRIVLLIASLLTIVCHYSSLIYHLVGNAINPEEVTTVYRFLRSNPNLVLPIYPCNFVMWACLILALIKNEKSKVFKGLVDFIFLFGIVSALAGIIANGDYFNGSKVNYDLYKSAVAHGFLLLNILLLPGLGYFKLDAFWNTIRTLIVTIIMGFDGLFCSLVALIVGSKDTMLSYNSMFLFRSPIEGLDFLRFYIVMPIYIVVLLLVLTIIELFKLPRGNRWFNNLRKDK